MTITNNQLLFAFILSLLAGLSTGIGSILAFLIGRTDRSFLAGILGFSAGIMIYVSMIEIFVEARSYLELVYSASKGYGLTILAFFWGILLIALLDKLIPEEKNLPKVHDYKLMRMGLFSAIAIALHNFPEGIATFTSAIQDPVLGISITIAIMIHNIPEGISVSIPIYYATGSKMKGFIYSFLSGLSEPLGALLSYWFLLRYLSNTIFGIILAAVAGIMVYISIDELLPTAEKYGEHKIVMYGLVLGMVVIAFSLLIFT
ncbi:MAG: zinc transporter ZupT [Bacilli bacterium]|jgi:ZIP family zinc transporter